MTQFIPRDYQSAAQRAVFKEWEEVCSTLVVIPTAGGKTILFAFIIKQAQPKRVMVIAERKELVNQAKDKIQLVTGLECGIERADSYVNNSLFGETPVVISTIQTQNSSFGDRKRMSRFNPHDFGLLIIDECHHSTAQSYKNLINYYRQNPNIKILGVTATPDRLDEEALGQVFETVAFDYEIIQAVTDGWLVPIDQQFVSIAGLDFSHIPTKAGDLNGADLAAVMEAESNLQGVAGATIDIIKDRRSIIFTASVKQAEVICNIFNRHKAGMAEWVCGATNEDVRAEIDSKFKRGEVQVVCNCGVYVEGYDNPLVEVVAMGRPTKSRAFYAQCCGRGMRPLTGILDGLNSPDERRAKIAASAKPNMTVLDFVGNSGKHKLMSSADILGGKVSDDAIARAVKIAKEKGGTIRMSEALDEAESDIRAEAEQRRLAEEARKAKLIAKVRYSSRAVNPFDVFEITPVKERGWDNGRTLSEKQRSFLMRQGVNPDAMSYAAGKQLLNELFRRLDGKLCTMKQASLLKRHGHDTKNMTMQEASRLIDQLAKNNWKPINQPFNGITVPSVPF